MIAFYKQSSKNIPLESAISLQRTTFFPESDTKSGPQHLSHRLQSAASSQVSLEVTGETQGDARDMSRVSVLR